MNRALSLLVCIVALVGCLAAHGCRRSTNAKAPDPTPSVRLYVLSTVAGAMEPCGCRKDMLGGVDHAAALIDAGKKEAPRSLIVGAGPMLFMNPSLDEQRKQQDLWKAESIAEALSDLDLVAWAPGLNDLAHGAPTLKALHERSGAALLAANAQGGGLAFEGTRVVDVEGIKVGIAGVSLLDASTAKARDVRVTDAAAALTTAKGKLEATGAQILVGLIAGPRGDALRIAESTKGFTVLVLGKAQDEGEGNDPPTDAVLVDGTLVVQPPNHLQAIGVVDLFVRDGKYEFSDGTGLEAKAKAASLDGRIAELDRRIAEWEKSGSVNGADLSARKADLKRLRAERSALDEPASAPKGSFFHYELREVRESAGSSAAIASRMGAYYQRVNERNRVAFEGRKPEPVEEGKPTYVGTQACIACHQEAYEVWKGTQHSNAYATLVRDHKQFNLDCVSCHVTAYDRPGGSTVTHVENLKNVQCEQCHGPGSLHVADGKAASIRAMPSPNVCTACHHPPHVTDDWDALKSWPKILGPGHGRPIPKSVAPAPSTAASPAPSTTAAPKSQ